MADTLYFPNNTAIRTIDVLNDTSNALWDTLESQFDWVKREEYISISPSYTHEHLEEVVTRTCVPTRSVGEILGRKFFSAHRLFGTESKTSSLYVTDIFLGDHPPWLPSSGAVIGETTHYDEVSRPCRPEMLNFSEQFFICNREDAGTKFGLYPEKLTNDSIYSALVVKGQSEPIAFRYYDTGFDWQSFYVALARAHGDLSLARELFNKLELPTGE